MTKRPIHFFLLPHQDDEYGVFYAIEDAIARGGRAVCFFLTDGGFGGADPAVRDAESRHVLCALRMPAADICFLGSTHGLPDGGLVSHLPDALLHLTKAAEAYGAPDFVYLPAWEGGHQDHDATHALGIVAACHWGGRAQLRQFPLYTAGRGLRPYRVLAPIAENGPTEAMPIPAARWTRYLRLCLSYRSQVKTMAALLPFITEHYILRGVQNLQAVDPSRLQERPHKGPLFYERHRKMPFEQFKKTLDIFLSAHPAASGPLKV